MMLTKTAATIGAINERARWRNAISRRRKIPASATG
jgi:hypothetical protein